MKIKGPRGGINSPGHPSDLVRQWVGHYRKGRVLINVTRNVDSKTYEVRIFNEEEASFIQYDMLTRARALNRFDMVVVNHSAGVEITVR